jgi:glycosyltransferase involved in cell wall biosynthesis
MNLSLAITTYNRFELTIESFAQVINDPRIDDIVILDDKSRDGSYEKLRDMFRDNPKVRVMRQAQNRGMGQNKADAISYCKNEWVIILDSDNIITPAYLNAIPETLDRDTIYQPSFAKPQFDFRNYTAKNYSIHEIRALIKHPMFNTMLNACNYLVNRDKYGMIYQPNESQKGADSIWFAYLWLKDGNFFTVVPGMEYEHRVHPGSGFLQDAAYNMKKAEEVRKLIMQL